MNGGYVHDRILLDALVCQFGLAGATVRCQVPSRPGRRTGYCDLTAQLADGRLIVVEIEMVIRRIANDIQKAVDLNADELWIVVPSAKVLRASKRHLLQMQPSTDLPIFVLTLPQALKRVSHCTGMPLVEQENKEIKKQIPKTRGDASWKSNGQTS